MKNTDWLKETYFAHRGFHSLESDTPENSMIAFNNALENGYGIECDVRLTKDRQLIVFHDHDLKRACNLETLIEDITYKDLLKYQLFGTSEKIPLLTNLLELINGKQPLLIELKTNNNAKELSKILYTTVKNYQGPFAIQSFDPRVLLWFKHHQPKILRGQIAELDKNKNHNWLTRYLNNHMLYNIITKPDFINYNISNMPLKLLDKLHNKNISILGYTAKSQKDYDFVLSHYDNVMFEGFHPETK